MTTQLNATIACSRNCGAGVLALAVLSQCDEPQYGYSLKQRLAELGLDINEGTLYPLLRRLEGQGLLHSEWRVVDETRPRRYYVLDEPGRRCCACCALSGRVWSRSWGGLRREIGDWRLTMQPKEWVDRYVNEVGRRLPGKQRGDVEMEMRSLIEDELDGLGHVPEERGAGSAGQVRST